MSQEGVVEAFAEEEFAPESDRPFNIETHGINIIPLADRHGKPEELFWLWFGGLIGIVDFVIGAVVVSLGLSLGEALSAIVIGDLSFVLIGLAAMAGPEAGTTTIVISRAPFGIRGNFLPAVLSWLTIVGWEGVNSVTGVLTVVEIFKVAGFGTGTGIKVISIVLFIAAMIIWAIWGHATIVTVQKIFAVLVGLAMLGVLYFGFQHADWSFAGGKPVTGSHFTTWIWAIFIVMAANGLGFMNMPADYTRYMPRSASKARIALYTALGAFIPTTILQSAGAIVGTKLNMFDPIGSLSNVMPKWFLVPFLAIAALSMVAANILNTYSSGLNLLALGVRLPRYVTVVFDAILVTLFVWIAIFLYNYVNTYTSFLSLTIWWFAPWTGIFLVDMYRRHIRYRSDDLVKTSGGAYWYRDGFNWRAIASLVVGAVAAALVTNSTLWVSPISKGPLGGLDLSVVVGLIVGAGLYWLLGSPAQEAAEPDQVLSTT